MDDGHESSNRNWWTIFSRAKYPAYVSLVEPSSIRGLDVKVARCQVKAILVDDVLDPAAHKKNGSQLPTQFEIREGSFVLALPDDAEPDRVIVSAPWLCLVNKIWLLPDGDSYKQPSGTTPDVQNWERQQIRQGRISVTNFQLAVTYFYRWSDYFKSVVKDNNNLERLTTSFRRLGVAQNRADTLALLEKRGCGNAPPTQFGMRYVMYSNHQTGDPPGSDDDDDDDDDVAEAGSNAPDDPTVPLESIMGVTKVLFLGSNDPLPHHKPTPAEVATVQSTIPNYRTLPPNGKTAVAKQAAAAGQLPAGFICNMFLEVRSSGVDKPRLYGLQEWAEGRAGTNLKQPWVAGSRAQIKQLLAATKNDLAQYRITPRRQQQWNDGAGTSAAAAAAAGGGVDSSGEYLDAHSNSADTSDGQDHDADESDELAEGPGQPSAVAAAVGTAGRRRQRTSAHQQRQQQRHTPRKVVGLDDDSSSSEHSSSSGGDSEGDDSEGGQDEPDHEQQQQQQKKKKNSEEQDEKQQHQQQQQSDDADQGTSDGSADIEIVGDRPGPAAASSDDEQQQNDDQDDDEADLSEDHDSSSRSSSSSDGSESDHNQQQQLQQAVHVSRTRQRDTKVHKATAAAAAAASPNGGTISVTAAVIAAGTPGGIKRKRPSTSTPQPAAAAGVAGSSSEADGSEDDVDHYLRSRDRAAAAAAGGSKRRKQQHSRQAATNRAKDVRERQTGGQVRHGSRGRGTSAGRQQQRHTS